jgi:hypothetical protein
MDVNFEILILIKRWLCAIYTFLRWLIDTCMLAGFELVYFVCL